MSKSIRRVLIQRGPSGLMLLPHEENGRRCPWCVVISEESGDAAGLDALLALLRGSPWTAEAPMTWTTAPSAEHFTSREFGIVSDVHADATMRAADAPLRVTVRPGNTHTSGDVWRFTKPPTPAVFRREIERLLALQPASCPPVRL